MLSVYVLLSVSLPARLAGIVGRREERGQASAEYALVLLGAAAIALLIVTWAARTNLVTRLLDAVLNDLIGRVR